MNSPKPELQHSRQAPITSGNIVIDVSTTFFPAAILPGAEGRAPDMVIFSRDSVFFYCHRPVLSSRSTNAFGFLLGITPSPGSTSNSSGASSLQAPLSSTSHSPAGSSGFTHTPSPPTHHPSLPTYAVVELGSVINVILNIVYDMPCRRFAPSLEVITSAIQSLEKYGITVPQPSHEIWSLVAQHAQHDGQSAIAAYTLAASQNLDSLSMQISTYTLGTSLTESITEADALTMGPLYLRRLFFLHIGRREALKRVLMAPPATHRPLPGCSMDDQAVVSRIWEVAVAGIMMGPTPQNTSADELKDAFGAVIKRRGACSACFDAVKTRVTQAVADWLAIKSTI